MKVRKIVVMGGSLARLRAAQTARKDGFDGDLVLIGGEACVRYDRPPLSRSCLGDDSPYAAVFHSESHLRDGLGLDPRHRAGVARVRRPPGGTGFRRPGHRYRR